MYESCKQHKSWDHLQETNNIHQTKTAIIHKVMVICKTKSYMSSAENQMLLLSQGYTT